MVTMNRSEIQLAQPKPCDTITSLISFLAYRALPLLASGLMLYEANNLASDHSYHAGIPSNVRIGVIIGCTLGGISFIVASLYYNINSAFNYFGCCAEPGRV